MGRRALALVVGLVVAGLALAHGASHVPAWQSDGADPARTLERFRDYLARKPFQDLAFDKMVEAAVSLNRLKEIRAEYEAALRDDPSNRSARIVLARLFVRMGEVEPALATLEPLHEEDAALEKLRGELYLARKDTARALESLDAAARLATDRELAQAVQERRGEAYLLLGDRAKAREAFHALAELEPTNFNLRLDAAGALARQGMLEEALSELEIAEGLAGDDNQKRCRVLAEAGKLQEVRRDGKAAIDTYARAIALMGRGNWLKADLYDRLLAIHQRAGTLAELVGSSAAEAAKSAKDLDAREFHARVLAAAGMGAQARLALEAATGDFPDDLALARRLIALCGELGLREEQIREYQRILLERPDELELYIELGTLFASDGRLEQARLQWSHTLESRLNDAGLASRLAGIYALYEMADDAVLMYERAIELEPGDARGYAELASFLSARERKLEIPAVLERAEAAVGAAGGGWEEVASLWREHGDSSRARAALEHALAARPEDARILRTLADLWAEDGDLERATELLIRAAERAEDVAQRGSAIDRVVLLWRRAGELDALEARAELLRASDTNARAAHLVLGKIALVERAPERARALYESLLALDPQSEEAQIQLARLYEGEGELERALAQYEVLAGGKPQNRRRFLKEMARLYLELFEQDEAFRCYDEILRASPDNAAAFVEVADAYQALGLHAQATECLEQATRLQPDEGRYHLRLAESYKRVGEWDKASAETLAARSDPDERVQAEAKTKHYALLVEAGRVEQEISALKRRAADNPYDVDAPLALADLYVREGENELALELIDRELVISPKSAPLLGERARILALLERYDAAILDYEALLKLPDADQKKLTLALGETLLGKGDVERARRVLAGLADVMAVASLYERLDAFEDAVGTLEKGLARAPGDEKLLKRLARVHEKSGEREKAAESFERLIGARGETWSALLELGRLYHELGREAEMQDVGRRLFQAVRIPEDAEAREDEDPDSARYRQAGFYQSWSQSAAQQYQNRVYELHQFFEGKQRLEDFVAIGAEEVALQPTNEVLVQSVLEAFSGLEDQGAAALGLVQRLTASLEATGRTPPSRTKDGWRRFLEGFKRAAYTSDAKESDGRLAAIAYLRKGGEAAAVDLLEEARLSASKNRIAACLESLAAGVDRFPEHEVLLAGLGATLLAEKRYDEALVPLRTLEALLASRGDDGEDRAQADANFRSRRLALLQGFPLNVRAKVDGASLRRLFDLTGGVFPSLDWGFGGRVNLPGVRQAIARCLLRSARTEEARGVLKSLEPASAEDVPGWARLADLYFEEDLYAEAETIYARLDALEEELSFHPIIGHNRAWESAFRAPMSNYARVLELRGEFVEAYDLLRTYGAATAGELVLSTNDAFAAAGERYQAEMEALEPELPEVHGDDPRAIRWRNAGVKLAEIQQFQKHWDAALAELQAVASKRPQDFVLLETLAQHHLRAGRFEAAIDCHGRIIAKKRELNRTVERPESPKGRVLVPILPQGVVQSTIYSLQHLRYGSSTSRFNVRENYIAIIQVYLNQKKGAKVAELLHELARENASSLRYMGWTIASLVQGAGLTDEALPIYKLLYGYNPDDEQLALAYGRELAAASRLDEAQRVLTTLAYRPRTSEYVRDQAEQELRGIEARLGSGKQVTIAGLETAVGADPKNVRQRTKLARRLFSERRFAEALEHAQSAEELAPNQDELRELVDDCFQVLGRHAELEARLEERRRKSTPGEERFGLTVKLANWAHERGDGAAVEALFAEALDLRSGWSGSFAPSAWFLSKGDFDTARARLASEIEELGKGRYDAWQAKARMQALLLREGDAAGALDITWELFEDAQTLGEKTGLFGTLAGVLRRLPFPAEARDSVLAACASYGGLRGAAYELAYLLAAGELLELERRADELVQAEPEAAWLYPVLVSLARERGDRAAAQAYLERLESTLPLSESRTIATSIGSLSEKNALRAELGCLLFQQSEQGEPGAKARAIALWREMFPPDDENALPQLAKLFGQFGLDQEASELHRAFLAKKGERRYLDLLDLARLEGALGRFDEALAICKRASILSTRNDQVRGLMLELHRKRGSVAVYLEELRAEAAGDLDDARVQREIARVALELEENALAREALERLYARDDQKQAVRPLLVNLDLAEGRVDAALGRMEDEVHSATDAWQKQNAAIALATIFLRHGEVARAEQALLKAHGDANRAQFRQTWVNQLMGAKRYAEALPWLEEALTYEPRAPWIHSTRAEALYRVGRVSEALEAVFTTLHSPELSYETHAFEWLPEAAESAGEDARLAAELSRAPDDLELLFRSAVLAARRRHYGEAALDFERLLARSPDDLNAWRFLWPCYDRLGRHADARAALERLIELADREQGVSLQDWDQTWMIQNAREELGRQCLREGDRAGALAEWARPLGERYAEVQSWMFTYDGNPVQDLAARSQWLLSHRFYAEYQEARRLLGWFEDWNWQASEAQVFEARFRAGDRGAAREALWRAFVEPGGALVQSVRSNRFYYGPEDEGEDARAATLIQLFYEDGCAEELLARVRTELAIRPEEARLLALERDSLAVLERHEELVVLERAALEKRPESSTILWRLARSLTELERFEEARTALQRNVVLARAESPFGEPREIVVTAGQRGAPLGVRFQWAGANAGGMGSSYTTTSYPYFGGGVSSSNAERELMAIAARLGLDDEARLLEERLRARTQLGYDAARELLALAHAYADLDVYPAAERIALEALAEEEELASEVYGLLTRMYGEAGAAEERRRCAEARLALLEQELLETPEAAALLIEKARFIRKGLGEPVHARAAVEAALAIDDRSVAALTDLGWIELDLGAAGEAVARFRAAERESEITGLQPGDELLFGLGLALARSGARDEAGPILRRALFGSPEHEAAEAAREALR